MGIHRSRWGDYYWRSRDWSHEERVKNDRLIAERERLGLQPNGFAPETQNAVDRMKAAGFTWAQMFVSARKRRDGTRLVAEIVLRDERPEAVEPKLSAILRAGVSVTRIMDGDGTVFYYRLVSDGRGAIENVTLEERARHLAPVGES